MRRWLNASGGKLVGRVVRVSLKADSILFVRFRVIHVDMPDGTVRVLEDQRDIGARLVNIGDPVAISINPVTSKIDIIPEGDHPNYLKTALVWLFVGVVSLTVGGLFLWNRLTVYQII